MGDLFEEISFALNDGLPEHPIPAEPRYQEAGDSVPKTHYNQPSYHRELDDFDRELLRETLSTWHHPPSQCPPQQSRPAQSTRKSVANSQLPTGGHFGRAETLARGAGKHVHTPKRQHPTSSSLMERFGFRPNLPSTPQLTDDDDGSQSNFSSPIPPRPSDNTPWKDLGFDTLKVKHNRPRSVQNNGRLSANFNSSNITRTKAPEIPYQSQSTTKTVQQPVIRGIELMPVGRLPDRFRSVFPYPFFNAVQTKCFEVAYNSMDNLIVSAPTGSGKTVVLELSICAMLKIFGQGSYKVIYLAPTKALCSERRKDWEKKFRNLGLNCTELTGDTDQAQISSVRQGDLIVTTPEKWDSMTRRWEDHRKLLDLVRLFLVSYGT